MCPRLTQRLTRTEHQVKYGKRWSKNVFNGKKGSKRETKTYHSDGFIINILLIDWQQLKWKLFDPFC